jgi:hypothetical protein
MKKLLFIIPILFVIMFIPKADAIEINGIYEIINIDTTGEYTIITFQNINDVNDVVSYRSDYILDAEDALPVEDNSIFSGFYIGDKYQLHYAITTMFVVSFYERGNTNNYKDYNYLIENNTVNNKFIFLKEEQDYYYFAGNDNNIYQIDKNLTSIYLYTTDLMSGMDVAVPLQFGNVYNFINPFNYFYPISAHSISYQIGYDTAIGELDEERKNAYDLGYNNALKYLEEEILNAKDEATKQALINLEQYLIEEYQKGYYDGYEAGGQDVSGLNLKISKLIPDSFAMIWNNSVAPFLNFKVFGISILDVVLSFMVMGLIMFFIKRFI